MSAIYSGRRTPTGGPWVTVVREEHGRARLRRLHIAPSLRLFNHSPSGFEWGYGGSGPAQLALAILLDHARRTMPQRKAAEEWAGRHHQAFKWAFVAKWSSAEGWRLTSDQITQWALSQTAEVSP